MADFKPALSKPGLWSVGDSQFDEGGKFVSLKIPVESIHEFCNYLMTMADGSSKHKTIKVWNYKNKAEEEVQGVVVSFKGQENEYGVFGQINPSKLTSSGGSPF